MTALAIALAGLLALSMASNVALFVALRGETKEGKAARDVIDQHQALADGYRSERDALTVKLRVNEDLLEQERTLRAVASMQRDAAQKRVGELLRKHIARATNEEIQELTNEAFASPLSLVPAAPGVLSSGVSQAVPRRSDSGADGLIDPFAEVQPPKPAG